MNIIGIISIGGLIAIALGAWWAADNDRTKGRALFFCAWVVGIVGLAWWMSRHG